MDKPVILVTGGSGFLGKHIVKELLARDSMLTPSEIRVLDVKDYPGQEEINFIKADVRNYTALKEACEGVDAIIHSAAVIDWGTHSPQHVYDVNVGGTENVIKACRELNIKYLVATSSLDALYTGKPLRDISDDQPYPEKFHGIYSKSKMLGEQLVMNANGPGLKTTVLRPCDIFGPSDPYHMNALIGMAKSGFYIRIGNGKAKTQHVFVGNMAHAHALALKALMGGNEKLRGQAYLITDGPGENFFRFFDQIILKAGYTFRPKNLWMPYGIAITLGVITEGIAWLVRPLVKFNPGLSRFAVNYICTDYTFSSKRAEEHFGFKPKYTEEEAIDLTAEYYRKN